jgi:hypothetical protein
MTLLPQPPECTSLSTPSLLSLTKKEEGRKGGKERDPLCRGCYKSGAMLEERAEEWKIKDTWVFHFLEFCFISILVFLSECHSRPKH